MKKIVKYLSLFFLMTFTFNVYATTYVDIGDLEYSSSLNNYSSIKEYDSLDTFIEDYNNSNLPSIYITNFLFDGVSSVKSPDLDDFIENNSNDTKIKELEIRVINLNTTGDIELTGESVGTMLAVNTNKINDDINIILNNVSIDTDSKKAPAIYIYNKDTTYTEHKVTIKTKANTKNYLEGGKLKKVSLLPKDSLDSYATYYSSTSLDNYNNYSNYYGIYTKEEINNILFATVKADSEDLSEGDPYYFYKGSGAISSDIDLYFVGEGYLKVVSKNKEGIETKGNLTFSGGTGDYEISSFDDALNTTTASSSGTNVRNNMVIDVNSLTCIVSDEGDEGDAIDSNGTLTINAGNIYAFAHSNSEDSGLDSETGTYINGGTIIATGNMADEISNDSKQKMIYVNFSEKISAGTYLVIKNQDDEVITAFKTNKDITTLLYSTSDLNYESFKIYSTNEIVGDDNNGLYTKIDSYGDLEELSYNEVSNNQNMLQMNNNQGNNIKQILLITLGIETFLLLIVLLLGLLLKNKK